MQNYSFFVFVSQTQKRIGELMSSARHSSSSILHRKTLDRGIGIYIVELRRAQVT